jgi:hypothetical protein
MVCIRRSFLFPTFVATPWLSRYGPLFYITKRPGSIVTLLRYYKFKVGVVHLSSWFVLRGVLAGEVRHFGMPEGGVREVIRANETRVTRDDS